MNPRWWRLVGLRGIRCPLGHHIPNLCGMTEDGFIHCNKLIDAGSIGQGNKLPRCDKIVFLVSVRGQGTFVFEVSESERDDLMGLSSTFDRLIYLFGTENAA